MSVVRELRQAGPAGRPDLTLLPGSRMLIVMRHGAAEDDIQRVVATIEEMGYQARPMPGKQRTTVGLVGNDGRVDGSRLAALPGVQEIIHVTQPYKQVCREWQPESTVVRLPGGLSVGGGRGRRDGGPLFRGERAPDPRGGPRRPRGRGHRAPRRGVQAAQLAVLVSGPGRAGLGLLAQGARGDRAPDRDGGDGRRGTRSGRGGRRHRTDRRAQHAELLPPQARRPAAASRSCSSAASPPRSRSCSSPPNTCSPKATAR